MVLCPFFLFFLLCLFPQFVEKAPSLTYGNNAFSVLVVMLDYQHTFAIARPTPQVLNMEMI